MRTIAIYTFVKEGDMMPSQPYNATYWKAKGFDFICFVTRKGDRQDFEGAWFIDELPVSWEDERLNALIPKLNPQSVLEGYEYSVWINSDVEISSDAFYEKCKEMQNRAVLYSVPRSHSFRSPYAYALSLWKNHLEPFEIIRSAICFLLLKGVGLFSGMQDTSFMFRKHEDEAVLEFDRWWWECLLTHGGGHYDMLMHSFALRDTPSLKWEYTDII